MLLAPRSQLDRQLERVLRIADEIVVDNEDFVAPAEFADEIELRDQLRGDFMRGLRP